MFSLAPAKESSPKTPGRSSRGKPGRNAMENDLSPQQAVGNMAIQHTSKTQQSIFDVSQLSLPQLKIKIIEAQDEGFWEEAERLEKALELRIQPLLVSEDVNQFSFEEVGERISEIQYWLYVFSEESANKTFSQLIIVVF